MENKQKNEKDERSFFSICYNAITTVGCKCKICKKWYCNYCKSKSIHCLKLRNEKETKERCNNLKHKYKIVFNLFNKEFGIIPRK